MLSTTPRTPAALLAIVTLVAAAVASLSPAAGAQPVPVPISAETFTLTILHNNDGESKLLPDPDGPRCSPRSQRSALRGSTRSSWSAICREWPRKSPA